MRARLLCVLVALGCSDPPPRAKASLWPEADALFHTDARWIGGDGAYSVDLGAGRVLWLFGDSFIASTPARVRSESKMVRNGIAVQTGLDPSNAFIEFHWPELDGEPQSFLPEESGQWYWPMHGVRLESRLLLFFERLHSPEGDPKGFENDAWRAISISNPDQSPSEWKQEALTPPSASHGVVLGEAALVRGDHLYLYGTGDDRHPIYLARLPLTFAEQGRFDALEWWDGSGYGKSPSAVVSFGAPELSVHYDERLDKYVMVHTEGYGATTLAWRVADAPEGPWSDPGDLLRPPESFEPDAFVYAGKGHPELAGADLVATYVPSSFEDRPLADESRLYYPHFVRVTYR